MPPDFHTLQPLLKTDRYRGGAIIIAGPCSAESPEQVMEAATALAAGGIHIFRAGLWKPRTHPGGFEGVGAEGLPWLAKAKEVTGMLTATEVANATHTRQALEGGVDIIWLGARTTANPFAVQEIADTLAAMGATDTPILVKNPVSPDLELWIGALQRLLGAGCTRLGAIHRGFGSYGEHTYRNPPMWQIPIELRRRIPALPIICDPSHITGRRDSIAEVSQQALDIGLDGLIIESHPCPDCALSDASQQLTPESLLAVLGSLNYRNAKLPADGLTQLRRDIDAIDAELVELLGRRMEISRRIGRYKLDHGVAVVQPGRYDDIVASRVAAAAERGLAPDFMRTVLSAIHAESVRQQLDLQGPA